MINYKELAKKLDSALNNSADRDEFVALLATKPFKNKAQLYAVLIAVMAVEPAVAGTTWDDMSQEQKELLTVYSQSAKLLGFIS